MSMYKTIFWSEAYDEYAAGDQVQSISGEVLVFGESAFASLDEAVASVQNENAIIVKVASGKYDGFTVVNQDGIAIEASQVVAVDFDGADVMVGGENLAIKASALDPIEQAEIISGLNDIKAAEGTVYVAAEYAPADASLMFIGAGNPATVVGGSATVVYGNNADEVASQLGNMLSPENAVTAAAAATNANELLVSTDYNSSTEGFGTTKFNSYNAAYAYAAANNKSATIVIEKSTSISGYCFDNNHKNYTNMAVVIEDGGVMGNAASKWDMTYDVTVKAGGTITMGRPKNASVSYTHVKSDLTIGEAGSTKKAVLNFLSDSYQDGDLQIRYNGKLVAYNAKIDVQDFDAQGSATLNDTEMYVDGVFATTSFYKTTLNNTDIVVGGTQIAGGLSDISGGGSFNQLGNITMTDSDVTFNSGTVKVAANVKVLGNSTLKAKDLVINTGKTLTVDSSSTITAETLDIAGTGKIQINMLDGFTGGKIIDITGATGLTDDILSKITISNTEYGAYIQDGDVFVAKNQTITSSPDSNTLISGNIVGNDVTITNSKEMAVTGSIEAKGDAMITNAAPEGEAEGKLNGGYDADGKELAAKITAENNIILQNDGHANVDLDAKTIIIANNSKNTLTGSIGTADTENVIVADGEATADGVLVDGNGVVDGAIKDAAITAEYVQISGQEVTGTDFKTPSLIISADAAFGADNTFTERSNIFLGTKENSVNATFDMSNTGKVGNIVAANGTVTLTGQMDETTAQGPQLDIGGFIPAGVGAKDNEMGSTTVNIAEGAYVKTHQVYIGENEAVNDHTLNVYGKLDTTASVFNKAKGELNVYGEMNIADEKYLQAAGDVTVSGANAELNVGGTDTYGIKVGTDEAGLRSNFTIENGASVNVDTLVEVGYSTTRNGDLNVTGGNLSANKMVVQSGSAFNVSGDSSLNIGTLTGAAAIVADAKLTDSNVGGKVSVGFDAENAADTTLTLKGETSIGTLYVGKEGRENEYNAVITGEDTEVSLGSLYNRLGSTLEITDGAHLEVSNYWQSKGDVVIDGASAELTGVNMYVYNNDSTDAATITLRNGASLSTKANYAIYLGNSEGGPAKGNASMTLESGSSLNVKNLTLHADGEVEEVAGA